jgi:phage anti-repressor protein
MNFFVTQAFQKKAQKLCRKDRRLRLQLAKQFSIFKKNHRHPSLKLHKLQGKRTEQYSIWIIGNLRAIGIKTDNDYVFFDLITHDQY